MEPLIKKEKNTIDDIYALPDGERAELIDGQILYGSARQNPSKDQLEITSGDCQLYRQQEWKL